MHHQDSILEGVVSSELAGLKSIAEGHNIPSGGGLARLAAKGWVDLVNGVLLITLTGRTLLDRSSSRRN